MHIAFQRADGRGAGGFGCSGVGVADAQRPVVLSVSGSYPAGCFCYVGQTVDATTRVALDLTNGLTVEAALVAERLPVRLWVAIVDDSVVCTEIRASTGAGVLGREPVGEVWLERRSSTVWGPV
jgi:hypothetical protein